MTKFDIGDGLQGMIGVVGPTRMDYAKVTARLSYFAESLTKMFGKNNQLLVRIPMDQKFFREMTTGKVVVMGRKTLESFPNGLPLKNRTNIVLTHNQQLKVKDAIVVHSMEELREELKKYNSEDIYIIGGEQIYKQLVDECDVAHITKIDYAYDADAYFPNLDEKPEWKITADSEEQTYFNLEFYFYKYERIK